MSRHFLNDLERSKTSVVKFFGWLLHLDMFGAQPDLASDSKLRRSDASGSCSLSILLDCEADLFLKVLVKGGKVLCVLLSCVQCHILNTDLKSQMILGCNMGSGNLHGLTGRVRHGLGMANDSATRAFLNEPKNVQNGQ
jgi:hypothetical protein